MPHRLAILALLLLTLCVSVGGGPPHAAHGQAAGWRDTGITLPAGHSDTCLDASQANTVLVNEQGTGTVAYNLATGARRVISPRLFRLCGADGWLYAGDNATGGGWRYSPADPTGTATAHVPSAVARDGSRLAYALDPPIAGGAPGHLWASSDAGRTWTERGTQFNGHIESLAVADADAAALYAVVVERSAYSTAATIYYSPDAGATWEPRWSETINSAPSPYGGPYYDVYSLPGHAAPVTTLTLIIDPGYPGSSNSQTVRVSGDGARSFRDVGTLAPGNSVRLVYTHEGLVRLTIGSDSFNAAYTLGLSTDNGATWTALPNPPSSLPVRVQSLNLQVARVAPANLFLNDSNALWHSMDGGHTWQRLADPGYSPIVPGRSLPLVLAAERDNHLVALDLPDAGTRLVAPLRPTNAPGSRYFSETGHTLDGALLAYWTAHGGLAQFGFPRTEPFRELNPADGQVYVAQYFERARLEYHPENAGTAYDVLLGLLGVQVTEARRAAGDPPFTRVADPQQPGVVYFAPTGHTLRLGFRAYWEAHGGLALYGYPISEEFTERNPGTGQTYTVQYFERNRFEYHPEYIGTPAEVLLGLLGNTVLDARGWR